MKNEEALTYLPKFPKLSESLEKEMQQLFSPYILYTHKSGKAPARCSHCGAEFDIYEALSPENVIHKVKRLCPFCVQEAMLIDVTNPYGGGSIEETRNAMVFLAGEDANLYIRCFAQRMFFQYGEIVPVIITQETQRYVFTKKKNARFGIENGWEYDGKYWVRVYTNDWILRTRTDEPNFYNRWNYSLLNIDDIKNTCLKYCAIEQMKFGYDFTPIRFLKFYQKYPGIERLIKCGFTDLVRQKVKAKYASYHYDSYRIVKIKWDETEVHKMLCISKEAFRVVREQNADLANFLRAAQEFPGFLPEQQIKFAQVVGWQYRTLDSVLQIIGENRKICLIKYLIKQGAEIDIYNDYIKDCQKLHYDLSKDIIAFPPHLTEAHDRAASAVAAVEAEKLAKKNAELQKEYEKSRKKRKVLEFESGEYFIRLPENSAEIIKEGLILGHCVAGYAERHLKGKLSIMFLRKKSEPEKPFYTIEVSTEYRIVQCRGYKNNLAGNPKPQEIIDLEKAYQAYLDKVCAKEQAKRKRKNSNIEKLRKGA